MLQGQNIVLGISGGIAAYKGAELVRLLVRREAHVRVLMTRNACEFITPLTLQALSGHPVLTETFALDESLDIQHTALAEWGELMVVAPATANLIGKVVSGIADDLLSTQLMAWDGPVLLCPAMNTKMWDNPVMQENLERLQDIFERRGEPGRLHVLDPGEGELACKTVGAGRLPEPLEIVDEIERIFSRNDLRGKRVLVSAGPTREPIDPVRYISNRSSGKMGYAIARAAAMRGAFTILVSGPTGLETPLGVNRIDVTTAEEMAHEILHYAPTSDIIVKAAAVADYTPRETAGKKIKKTEESLEIPLQRTTDILAELGKTKKPEQILVGFAAETNDGPAHARDKLERKGADFIVLNDVTQPGAGFDVDTNIATILQRHPNGQVTEIACPRMTKDDLAQHLFDILLAGGPDDDLVA